MFYDNINYYIFIMYGLRSKLMCFCLSKPVEVTDNSKKHYLTMVSVHFPKVTNP